MKVRHFLIGVCVALGVVGVSMVAGVGAPPVAADTFCGVGTHYVVALAGNADVCAIGSDGGVTVDSPGFDGPLVLFDNESDADDFAATYPAAVVQSSGPVWSFSTPGDPILLPAGSLAWWFTEDINGMVVTSVGGTYPAPPSWASFILGEPVPDVTTTSGASTTTVDSPSSSCEAATPLAGMREFCEAAVDARDGISGTVIVGLVSIGLVGVGLVVVLVWLRRVRVAA